ESILIDGYEWKEQYKGSNKKKHKILHLNCGEIYEVRPNDFQQGYRCPFCQNGYSEKLRLFNRYLLDNNIPNRKEISMSEITVDPGYVYFKYDYLINDTFIEYDGSQHFKVNRSSVFEKTFNNNKKYDKIKNNNILNSRYRILRISYKIDLDIMIEIVDNIIHDQDDKLLQIIKDNKLLYIDGRNKDIINGEEYYTNLNDKYFL